jgi:tight adherence protein B
MRRTRCIAVAALAALAAAAATPVLAAEVAGTAGLEVVEAGTALFPDRSYVLTLTTPRESALTTEDVTVTEDGKPVQNVSVLSAASAEGIGTVLLIDSSNSMKGSIDEAMAAARAFTARNPGQPLSVVFFNAKPTVALPLTTERAKVAAVLAKPPKLAEGTHIYDALAAAVAQVRGSALGAARVVLLSDGDDVGSLTTLDAALTQLDAQKIRVYTVGIQSPDFTPDDLGRIADDTGGSYAEATSSSGLTEIYEELGFQLGNEYLLRYRSTAQPDQQVDVNIGVAGVAQPVSFSYTSPSTGTAAPYKPAFKDQLLQSWVLLPLIVALVLGLAALAIRFFWNLRSNKALVSRLGEFVTLPSEERATERRKEVDHLLAAAGEQKKRKRNFRWVEGFAEDCDVGQIKYDPRRMLILAVLVGLALGAVVAVLVSPLWFFVVALGIPIALNMFVRNKARRQRNEFAEQLPENLDVLASALRAGHSLAGAMSVVADEAPEPSKREFTRVVTDEQLGIPLDEALEVTAKRMQNVDMDQVAVLALVQREAGGNTAEVLDQVIANIRARMDLRRMVTVLTAQGKFSSWIVAAVPVGLFLFILLVNPNQLDPLFNRTLGQVAAISALVMVVAGFIIIRKIVTIEL